MPLDLTPDPEDPEFQRWLLEQAQQDEHLLGQLFEDPAKHPIALEADRSRPAAPLPGPKPLAGQPAEAPRSPVPGVQLPTVPPPSPMLRPRPSAPAASASMAPAPRMGSDVHIAPPSKSSGFSMDEGGLILGLFADLMLNKGRGGEAILKLYTERGKDDLDRRLKEAQIANYEAQAANGGRRYGMSPEQLELSRERLELSKEKYASDQAATAAELEKKKRENQLDSPETKEAQDGLIAIGYDEATARRMTAAQIYKFRPQLGQRISQDHGQELWGDRHEAEQIAQLRKEGRHEEAQIREEQRKERLKIEEEKRAANKQAEEAQIPGYRQTKRLNDQQAKQAVDFVTAIEEIEAQASALDAIQKKIGAYGALGQINQIANPQVLDLLYEANQRQLHLESAIRQLAHWGVPQEYELNRLKEAYPPADSVRGVLAAGRAYRAAARIAKEQALRKLRTMGYEPDGSRPDPNAPRVITRPINGSDDPPPRRKRHSNADTEGL